MKNIWEVCHHPEKMRSQKFQLFRGSTFQFVENKIE